MMTLRQIEVIRAVMVTGTIGGAAKLLNVSAPGISRLVKYTEKSLGIRFFQRQNGRYPQASEPVFSMPRISRICCRCCVSSRIRATARSLGNRLGLRRLLFQSLGGLAHLHLTAGRLGCSTGTTPRLRLGSECREGTPVYAWARNSDHQNCESGSARSDSGVQELLHRGWHFVVLRKA